MNEYEDFWKCGLCNKQSSSIVNTAEGKRCNQCKAKSLPTHYSCRECGEAYDASLTNKELGARLELAHLCFGCDFWVEKTDWKSVSDPDAVRIGGQHYYIGPEDAPASWRGFGGFPHTIRFLDGRVVRSTNLWSQGDNPGSFPRAFARQCRVRQG